MKNQYLKFVNLLFFTFCYTISFGQCNVSAPSTVPNGRCSSGTLTLAANNCSGTYKWYDAAIGGTLVGTTYPFRPEIGANNTWFTTPILSTSTTYYVECLSGSCTSVRNPVTASIITTPPVSNCAVDAPNGYVSGITYGYNNFSFEGIKSYNVFNSNGNYRDFTCSSQSVVTVSNTYSFNLNLTKPSPVVIYIDFNNNGDFYDEGEQVFSWNTSILGTHYSSTITFPTNTVTNTNLRMRLLIDINAEYPCELPGTGYGSGVAVDFSVFVQPCLSIPAPPTAVSSPQNSCGAVPLTASGCVGIYSWYIDEPTKGTLLGNGSNYNALIPGFNHYYVDCKENGCTSLRTLVDATVNPIPTNINHSGNISTGTYSASSSIISSANVATSSKYYAGKSIILNAGFSAGSNETFEAKVQGCN